MSRNKEFVKSVKGEPDERKEKCHFADTTTAEVALNGGKYYLANDIIKFFPRHLHYVEPYFGGGAVLLNRDPNDESLWLPPHKGVSEIANDLNGELTNFWKVLQDPTTFEEFRRRLIVTPLSRLQFLVAQEMATVPPSDPVLRAWGFFIRCRQSRAGSFKGFTSLTRNRLRRGVNGNVSEWLGCVEGLPEVHARLQPVVIENIPALDLIRREDAPGTLFYCDPPYLHETRVTTDAYAIEMNEQDHKDLLTVLAGIKGKFLLSGYPSTLYEEAKTRCGWKRYEFSLPNHAAGGSRKRRMVECVWTNF